MLEPPDLERLRHFHAIHFPGQSIPRTNGATWAADALPTREQETTVDEDDYLGYYEDGVKRTLTDEQIKIFRHSEVQRLLREKRLQAEERERKSVARKARQGRRSEPPVKQKRYFEDHPKQGDPQLGALNYDDQPDAAGSAASKKEFLWPTLGTSPCAKPG